MHPKCVIFTVLSLKKHDYWLWNRQKTQLLKLQNHKTSHCCWNSFPCANLGNVHAKIFIRIENLVAKSRLFYKCYELVLFG